MHEKIVIEPTIFNRKKSILTSDRNIFCKYVLESAQPWKRKFLLAYQVLFRYWVQENSRCCAQKQVMI